jgi:GlcNAc-P-P-Und epimerase
MEDRQPNGTERNAVVILGGSGFIGTKLVEMLIAQGMKITIGDTRQSERYPELWQFCDVRDANAVTGLLSGATTVITPAAEHRDDVRPVSRYHEVNVDGAAAACLAARQAGVQRIVFTSSVAVYGFQSRPVDEEGPFQPFNAYGKTKLEAESVYKSWAVENGCAR